MRSPPTTRHQRLMWGSEAVSTAFPISKPSLSWFREWMRSRRRLPQLPEVEPALKLVRAPTDLTGALQPTIGELDIGVATVARQAQAEGGALMVRPARSLPRERPG